MECEHIFGDWELHDDYKLRVCTQCGDIDIEPLDADDFPDDDFDFDDDESDDFEAEFERALSECGMTEEGVCMLAGTEYCDWECPLQKYDFGDEFDEATE